MTELQPPVTHYLNAALGWLELGNPAEARLELDWVPLPLREHPEVLKVWWEVLAREKKWEPALELSRKLVALEPDRADGWIKQAFGLHELKRTEEARRHLLEANKKFPDLSIIPYNLACYSCQLGDLPQAHEWLARAIRIGGKKRIKSMALEDPDLKPMRGEIEGL